MNVKIKANINTKTLTPEEVKQNLNRLQEGVNEVQDIMNMLLPEAIIESEVKDFGNSSHIILPKEYAKKKAVVIIKK